MAPGSVTQSQPPGSNGGDLASRPAHGGVWLSRDEWTEATDIDKAFFAALRCEDVDNPHKIELLKCCLVRFSRFVYNIERRLNPSDDN